MFCTKIFLQTKYLSSNLIGFTRITVLPRDGNIEQTRTFFQKGTKDKVTCVCSKDKKDEEDEFECPPKPPPSGCRKAYADMPEEPTCPPDGLKKKKCRKGILHQIKLKIVEGGTNFGTPFRRLRCKTKKDGICKEVVEPEPKALPEPVSKLGPKPVKRGGMQVAVLGADTAMGQYIALLLKQCPCIKKLRLYEATSCGDCGRNLCNVVQDLQHIDTNCAVAAYSCAFSELSRCLQAADIVLMLESACVSGDMPLDKRFCCQAPIVKHYADCIATECPTAFIIVCATPIDCMVPLIAQTMKETGWYDSRKLLGSLAVQEMRASTLAARALCLEPKYTRVPCVGGTEGESLVPLFSKALEYFDFAQHNAMLMTDAVREAPAAVSYCDGCCMRAAELSEAHAIAGLVTKVAHAMLCHEAPRVSGFVETDVSQVISPARFIGNPVELSKHGIEKWLGLPPMADREITAVNLALIDLEQKLDYVHDWYCKYMGSAVSLHACQNQFFKPLSPRFDDCAYANVI